MAHAAEVFHEREALGHREGEDRFAVLASLILERAERDGGTIDAEPLGA